MMRVRPSALVWPFLLLLLWLAACQKPVAEDHDHAEEKGPSGRTAVPELVRKNLGIAFVTAERRRVAATIRLPGCFELLPSGRREHRTPVAGRVLPEVAPLQVVQAGDALFELDAPEWRKLQRELQDLVTARGVTEAKLASMTPLMAAHEAHERGLEKARVVVAERVEQLETMRRDVGGQAAEISAARLQLAQSEAGLAEVGEKHAELMALRQELEAELAANAERFDFAIDAAAAVSSLSREELLAVEPTTKAPRWRTLHSIEVRASCAGIADRLGVAPGAWVEAGTLVVEIVDPSQLRFRARGLQSDLARLKDGLPARLVAPGADAERVPSIASTLQVGLSADAEQRTIDLFVAVPDVPAWARPEVAAFVEIEVESGAAQELAIPSRSVLQDGLDRVFFRRDPKDGDTVIRVLADLGVDDGRWIEVKSGLVDGEQVVLDGAYELVLATSGTSQKAGHFHADGTFHADDEDH